MHNICLRFETSWGLVYLEKLSESLLHEAFHVATKTTLNADKKRGAAIGYDVRFSIYITTSVAICDYHEGKKKIGLTYNLDFASA